MKLFHFISITTLDNFAQQEFERQQREQQEYERQQREQDEYERHQWEQMQQQQEFERHQREQQQQQEFERQQREQQEETQQPERQHDDQHQLVVVPETITRASGWRRENPKAASIRNMVESNHSSLAAATSPKGQKAKRDSFIRAKRNQNSLDMANSAAAAAEDALDNEDEANVAAVRAANENDLNALDDEITALQAEMDSVFSDFL